ncbi:hypothetical protein DRB96_13860 [Streptomyces sp. ICC1]|nr:hypothetical protein DRB96_13860 [Streptomyces sp. ICC1]
MAVSASSGTEIRRCEPVAVRASPGVEPVTLIRRCEPVDVTGGFRGACGSRVTCGKPTAGVPKAGVSLSRTGAVAVCPPAGAPLPRGAPRQSPYTELPGTEPAGTEPAATGPDGAGAPQAPPGSYCWGWPPRAPDGCPGRGAGT